MHPLANGIYWGLLLAVLVGPVLFILIQTGFERGVKAGVTIAGGMWVSDLLFVLAAFFGLSYLVQATEWPGFDLALGIIGGAVLLVIGFSTLFDNSQANGGGIVASGKGIGLWLKGFMINSLNPFTIIFWITITTTIVTDSYAGSNEAIWFFVGILGTIVVTDCIKVLLAKGLRNWLNDEHVRWVRRVTGLILLLLGAGFIVRVIV